MSDSRGPKEGAEPIGRDHERAAVGELLDAAPQGSASLLLSGPAGIGKTTLWRWGIEEAGRRGMTVLSARAAESEAEASFTTLTDVLDPFLEDLLPSLPTPQAEALEVALLRRSSRVPIGDRVVGAAVLSAFRELGRRGTTVVALDDVQWVDIASAAALSFAIRRLDGEPVGVLATERPIAPVEGEPLRSDGEARGVLVQALRTGERLRRVELDGLSIAALHSMLARSFGHGIARPLLLRIHRATSGNPLFALELARAIGDLDVRPHEPLPVPADLQQLVLGRVRGLSPEVRDALLVAAALPAPSTTVVELAGGENVGDSLDAAQASGIIWIAGDSIAFEHPLFASAVYASAAPHRRRSVHARLARVLPDPEERARHLALATAEPDEDVAAMLEEAGDIAKARGARAAAAELFEMAAKLTPQDAPESLLAWGRRITDAALCHHEAGSGGEARRLLHEAIDRLPAGPVRAEALWTLVYTETEWDRTGDLCRQAAAEAGGDADLLARIQISMAEWRWMEGGIEAAVQETDAGVALAEQTTDPSLLTWALALAGNAHAAAGLPDGEDMLRRAVATMPPDADIPSWYRPGHWLGCTLSWADRLDEARPLLLQEYERSELTGNDVDRGGLAFHLCQLECRAGRLSVARTYGELAVDLSVRQGSDQQFGLESAGLARVEALQGNVEEARSLSRRGLEINARLGDRLSGFHHRCILGFIELSVGDPQGAHAQLDGMLEELDELGIGEPGLYPFLPDEVEALIGLGLLEEAERLTARIERQGRELDRPRLLATGARCRGLIEAAQGDVEGALMSLDLALEQHERLPVPFELGRTLLAKGQTLRRLKQKRTARASLEEAARVFDSLPAPLWAGRARAELERIGGRPSTSTELTPTERAIAEHVAQGMSNKEVAEAVFLSVHTVEANLTRIYAKLRIHSRTELVLAMAPPDHPEG